MLELIIGKQKVEQFTLWDFIPECENGHKAESHLYFNEDADRYLLRDNPYGHTDFKQIDMFDFLDLSVEELYSMSNLMLTTEEEDRTFLKYLRSLQNSSDKRLYPILEHEISYIYFKHGWIYHPIIYFNTENLSTANALKDRLGNKEPQNSFFNHESVFLKGLNKMFERRNRYGKKSYHK